MSKSMGMRCLYTGATSCLVENEMKTVVDKILPPDPRISLCSSTDFICSNTAPERILIF